MSKKIPMDQLLNVASVSTELFDEERLDLMRSASYNRIASRAGVPDISPDTIRNKYVNLSKEEILDVVVNTETELMSVEDENYALIEQLRQLRSDLLALQSEFNKFKLSNLEKVTGLGKELESAQAQLAQKDAEIIFLQDHARFSNEQTKLSISHWDLLLKNRDENIDLLSSRINQLTADSRATGNTGSLPIDKYKCLLERYESAINEKRFDDLAIIPEEEKVECPWKHQAEVRVAQLERVTAQLNSTYEQLHTKSDELLLLNRTVGSLRSSNSDMESRLRKYKNRISRLKQRLPSSPVETISNRVDSTGMTTPSIESSE